MGLECPILSIGVVGRNPADAEASPRIGQSKAYGLIAADGMTSSTLGPGRPAGQMRSIQDGGLSETDQGSSLEAVSLPSFNQFASREQEVR